MVRTCASPVWEVQGRWRALGGAGSSRSPWCVPETQSRSRGMACLGREQLQPHPPLLPLPAPCTHRFSMALAGGAGMSLESVTTGELQT